ncbi:sugar nucleotide-binding protein [Inconstantimicrobium mannanitabidum]|uniref:Uncharacterized protein n=1 Tax=Inconstantimicrobium mannanitabidum TaxID=1604901 RepID=A0ACB5RB95_9CLOT|nr:sugar nucleotide-binding protein [Clostridium sp. TW13]GKX66495.1 hypothetical protein rsdtw13_17530 [Clostridium sp. TW13]
MNILILGASGFLGGKLYMALDKEVKFNILGTCFQSDSTNELLRIDVTNRDEVKCMMAEFNPDVVIWSLMSKTNEKYLIENGMKNILEFFPSEKKMIFISSNAVFHGRKGNYTEDNIPTYKNSTSPIAIYSNAKIYGEKMVQKRENYMIIRPGAIYGKDAKGKWDKRISQLIDKLDNKEEIIRTDNLFNTFVEVDELACAIVKLINMDYKGVVHLGPQRKESYYNYYKRMAKNLSLDDSLIKSNSISAEYAEENGISMDQSIDTSKCRTLFGDIFSNV